MWKNQKGIKKQGILQTIFQYWTYRIVSHVGTVDVDVGIQGIILQVHTCIVYFWKVTKFEAYNHIWRPFQITTYGEVNQEL